MERIKTTIPHAQLEISRSAVLNNYRYYRSKLDPGTKMLVVVKANSYGHGATEFAKLLEEAGVDYLGVATPLEGIRLRKDGIKLPILVLTTGTESYPEIIEYDLEPGIPTMEALKRFSEEVAKSGRSGYPVHITLDTGMHRLGFVQQELDSLIAFLKIGKNLKVKSLYSHLAAADEYVHDDFTRGQIALFEQMSERLSASFGYRPLRHILNTAGIERFTEFQMDMVRLGLGILFDEGLKLRGITGHGGIFKTPGVGQRMLAAALNSPISVMETAGEGGAWGIALLAGYVVNNPNKLSLADYLETVVFAGNTGTSIAPTAEDVAGFERYIENYKRCLPVEQCAVDHKA